MSDLAFPRALVFLTGALALAAASAGALMPELYPPVVAASILPGVFTQDLFAVAAGLLLVFLAFRLRRSAPRIAVVVLGLLGFLFYAYGIYAIEQVYTPLYPLYLAVLSLSFYTLAYLLATLQRFVPTAPHLPVALRTVAAVYGAFVAVMFTVVWLGQLVPLLRAGDRIEYLFSVFIIDLVFVMPAFFVAALLALRGRTLGLVALPALFVLGVGILAPLALAEAIKPLRYGLPFDPGGFWLYATLSLVFVLLSGAYLVTLEPHDDSETRSRGVRRKAEVPPRRSV